MCRAHALIASLTRAWAYPWKTQKYPIPWGVISGDWFTLNSPIFLPSLANQSQHKRKFIESQKTQKIEHHLAVHYNWYFLYRIWWFALHYTQYPIYQTWAQNYREESGLGADLRTLKDQSAELHKKKKSTKRKLENEPADRECGWDESGRAPIVWEESQSTACTLAEQVNRFPANICFHVGAWQTSHFV